MFESLFQQAKNQTTILRRLTLEERNQALSCIASTLEANIPVILEANEIDLQKAHLANNEQALLDRLVFTEKRIRQSCDDIKSIISLSDPLNQLLWETTRPNQLHIQKKSIPLGLIGIVYEARPNVTIDIISLAIKTGNACILRGGKEARLTNLALMKIIHQAIQFIIPIEAYQYIDDPDRSGFHALLNAQGIVDCVIPRGGKGLIQAVLKESRVPVIETGAGNCHLYIDDEADLVMGLAIAKNAKMSRPSVCNAIETILVHEAIAPVFLPKLVDVFEGKVIIRGCEDTRKIICCEIATEEDYWTEYNDLIIAVKIVANIDEAITHINHYSTHHSEAIITKNDAHAKQFLQDVDSACVYHNASTRFSDGGEFGFGAEVGISTQKMHARGPMGLEALTSYQYQVIGGGQIR